MMKLAENSRRAVGERPDQGDPIIDQAVIKPNEGYANVSLHQPRTNEKIELLMRLTHDLAKFCVNDVHLAISDADCTGRD
jgi:hypothetical protein